MQVLVTGAGGFSGAFVCREFLRRGHAVTGLYRATSDNVPGVTPVLADLADGPPPLDGVDAIIHTAATSPAPSVGDAAIVRDNEHAAKILFAAAAKAGVETVVFFSSLSIYGEITVAEVDETTPSCNPDIYGRSKAASERHLASLGAGRFRSVALRLPGIIGPGSVRNWLTDVRAKAMAGEDIRIFNATAPFNNAIHVDRLAAFAADLSVGDWSGHAPLTIAADGTVTIREVVDIVNAACGRRSRVIEMDQVKTAFTISNVRASRNFGYQPEKIADLLQRFGAGG